MKRCLTIALLALVPSTAFAKDVERYSVPEIVRNSLPGLQCYHDEVEKAGLYNEPEAQTDQSTKGGQGRLQNIVESCQLREGADNSKQLLAAANPSLTARDVSQTVDRVYGTLIQFHRMRMDVRTEYRWVTGRRGNRGIFETNGCRTSAQKKIRHNRTDCALITGSRTGR